MIKGKSRSILIYKTICDMVQMLTHKGAVFVQSNHSG